MKRKFTLLFVAAILLLFSACSKKSNDAPKNTAPVITATYYFQGTLNGQLTTWQVTNGVTGFVAGSSPNATTSLGVVSGITALLSAATGTLQFGVEFRTFQVTAGQDITAYFNGFVNTGAWTYATTSAYTPGTKAIAIYYTDSQGNGYSSIGAQSGSSANVISISQVAATIDTNEALSIELTFNCTLYPISGTGSNITLTNGKASVLLEDILY
jgi:hypothetical protein